MTHTEASLMALADEYASIVARAERAEAEVERLRKGGCARDQGLTQYCAEAADARGIAQALEKDAKRYRWIKSQWPHENGGEFEPIWQGTVVDEVDDAIDAAIRDQEGK